MSATITTSGSHGINGDVNASGTIKATAIDATIVKINGSDITSSLTGAADVGVKVNNIISGTQAVGLANTVASAVIDTTSTSSYPLYFGSSGAVKTATTLTYQPKNTVSNRSFLNLGAGNITLNGDLTDETFINGTLNCGSTALIQGALTCNGAVEIKGKLTCDLGELVIGGLTVSGALVHSGGTIQLGSTSSDTVTINGAATCNNGLTLASNLNHTTGTSTLTNLTVKGGVVFDNYITFKPNASPNPITKDYSTLLTVNSGSLASNALNIWGGGGLFYQTTVLNLQVATNPIINIPDPSSYLLGQEIRFYRDPLSPVANASCKLQVSASVGGFIVSSTPGTNQFQLGNSGTGWFKVFFQCIMLSDSKYYWVQTIYQ